GKPCAGEPHARFDEGGQARACSLLYPFLFLADCVDPRDGMAKAYRSGDYAMKEIAQQFGVYYSTVSRAVKARKDT
ncbi:MAG: hypothetical protein ACRESZ_05895, partial [Methylococcales bacterium]